MTLLSLTDIVATARLRVPALTLRAGITVVVGDNGAGKSTLLDLLAGVLRPDHGVVDLDGIGLSSLTHSARAAQIASLGQYTALVPQLTGEARIAQGLVPRRGPRAALDDLSRAAAHAVAAELGVQSLLSRRLGSLSGGQRQRLHVGRALVDDRASVIILDEPFAGLDDGATALLVAALHRRADHRVMVVSVHDLGIALALSGRLLGVRGGEIVADTAVEALLDPTNAAPENADRIFSDPVRVVRDGEFVGVLRRQRSGTS